MSDPKKRSALLAKIVASVAIFGFLVIAIPNFIRARNTPARNACVNNLRQINGAKQQWALENQKVQMTFQPVWTLLFISKTAHSRIVLMVAHTSSVA